MKPQSERQQSGSSGSPEPSRSAESSQPDESVRRSESSQPGDSSQREESNQREESSQPEESGLREDTSQPEESSPPPESTSPPDPGPPAEASDAAEASHVDRRMADILSGESHNLRDLRTELQHESTEQSDDLLERLGALEFVDSLVGDGLDMPDQLGDYEIKGVLGRGGMGTVYLAWQELLEREVALKVLAPRFSTDLTMRKRFRSEARASAAMHHQHIVPIYDYGEAQGHLYFAMELVHGVSLDRHISAMRRHDKGCMEPREAARRFAGVADALALAHKRHILHRDVKPGNIMVHRDGTLALVDFGLSKFMNRKSMNLTSVGGFLGTLHYSPPEQARSQEVTPASDLYSLGVTIFEAVTGQLPLSGDSTEGMLQSLLNEEPRRLRQILPKAPRDLQSVLDKLMNKDPRDRYADGEALALDLRRIAEGEPIRIRGQTWWGRQWRRAKRKPVQSAALATVVVLLLATLVFMRNWIVSRADLGGARELRDAYASALAAPGHPFGPQGQLTVLTGVASDTTVQNADFDKHLRRAERGSDEGEPERYRAAYYLDPDPVASELLRQGLGLSAWKKLGAELQQNSPQSPRFKMNEVAWLQLYPLYLGRAIAALTSSMGDLAKAREDLQYASFVRPGAFLPRLLKHFVEWQPSRGPEALIATLSALLVDPELPGLSRRAARRAAGSMLLAFADIAPPRSAHLMRFEMNYSARKRLHDQGRQWVGSDAVLGEGNLRGLEVELSGRAKEALDAQGNLLRMDRALADGHRLLAEEISPTSRLQCWAATYALVADQKVDKMTPSQQVRGAAALLLLGPDQAWLQNKRGELYNLAGLKDPGVKTADVSKLTALLDQRLGTPDAFYKSSEAWARAAPYDPEALLCRFLGRLGKVSTGLSLAQLGRFAVDGARLVQQAADPAAFQARLIKSIREELNKTANTARKRSLQQILNKFFSRGP